MLFCGSSLIFILAVPLTSTSWHTHENGFIQVLTWQECECVCAWVIWRIHFGPNCYLIHAAQGGLFCACDQMSSNADHIDLVLLKQGRTGCQRGEEALPHNKIYVYTLRSVHLLVELCHALLWDVIGANDDQWIEGWDGETEEKAKNSRLRQECCLEERCMFSLQLSERGTSLTACRRVWRHDGHPPIACRGPHCPDAPQQACSPAHTSPGPQRRSSTGHCLNCTHTFHATLESGVSFPVTYWK